MDFQELKQNRSDWVDINRKNNFEQGIINLLTELYPDNAHFVYELLQNAEDAQATEVLFNLQKDRLIFTHNGKRLFDIRDIESITSIGVSTKKDDVTTIGKFGVGFKAVFAYTNTPQIHSGDWHFKIDNLVVPNQISAPENWIANKTQFVFPFNNSKKQPQKAFDEIKSALTVLNDSTILFLSNIHTLKYQILDGSITTLTRSDCKDNVIDITTNILKDESQKSYLFFEKIIQIDSDDAHTGVKNDYRIAIAYELARDGGKGERKQKIISANPNGSVCIFFPAEKETSKLNFHIHAPFASTVARDSIRDCEENNQLRDEIAQLVVESLFAIRDMGLLTMDFLNVLPNYDDQLSPYYLPIQSAIINSFQNEDLTPTRSNEYKPSGCLYRGAASMADVIDDECLSLFTGYVTPLWVKNAPQIHQRNDKFLESLQIEEWGWYELQEALKNNGEMKEFQTWLKKKSDVKIRAMYRLFKKALDEDNMFTDDFKSVPLVRIQSDVIEHRCAHEVFFENEYSKVPQNKYLVSAAVYKNDTERQFLEKIGVRQYDEVTAISEELEHYGTLKSISANARDIKRYISFLEKNPDKASLFQGKRFLLNDQQKYTSPENIWLDEPYYPTGFKRAYTNITYLSDQYQEQFKARGSRQGLVDFLKKIGAQHSLKIVKQSCRKVDDITIRQHLLNRRGARHTHTGVDSDWTINHLKKLIGISLIRSNNAFLKLIWEAIVSADKKITEARYRPNQEYPIQTAPSTIVRILKNECWIPTKFGEFKMPCDMTREELQDDFIYDDRNGFLTAIGFGDTARKQSEQYKQRENQAQALGFIDMTELEMAKQLADIAREKNIPLAEIRKELQIKYAHTIEPPLANVSNPERRRKGVTERSENAPSIVQITKERQIQKGLSDIQAHSKAYLRQNYTNEMGEMSCQCCRAEMPFKINNEYYYFEAVQCFDNFGKEYFETRLALCPTCAAMYKYARRTMDATLIELIRSKQIDGSESIQIPIELADSQYNLFFVGRHIFDIYTLLSL